MSRHQKSMGQIKIYDNWSYDLRTIPLYDQERIKDELLWYREKGPPTQPDLFDYSWLFSPDCEHYGNILASKFVALIGIHFEPHPKTPFQVVGTNTLGGCWRSWLYLTKRAYTLHVYPQTLYVHFS